MKISIFNPEESQNVIDLFRRVFTNSEGIEEGEIVSKLVTDLITTTVTPNLFGFVACSEENEEIIGCVFFSRLNISNNKTAFILSPLAVKTEQQGKGIGQKLILFGLEHLKSLNIDFVFTYGDPNYYSKTGFQQIDESLVLPPQKLSYPEGWLALSLSGDSISLIEGKTECVKALNNPKLW